MSKGLSFDQLYPGTYLKAGEFDGKPVTLTITGVTREMLSNGNGSEEGAVIVSFSETEKKLVLVKTNGVCCRAMWGDDSGDWVGHKITLHPVPDASGLSESGLCIRVKGSPELTAPVKFKARLGRKMVTQTLQPTAKRNAKTAVEEQEGGFSASPADEGVPSAEDAPDPENGFFEDTEAGA